MRAEDEGEEWRCFPCRRCYSKPPRQDMSQPGVPTERGLGRRRWMEDIETVAARAETSEASQLSPLERRLDRCTPTIKVRCSCTTPSKLVPQLLYLVCARIRRTKLNLRDRDTRCFVLNPFSAPSIQCISTSSRGSILLSDYILRCMREMLTWVQKQYQSGCAR